MAELKVSSLSLQLSSPLPSPKANILPVPSQEFDKLLTATITAPRLSGSKVQKLASQAIELVAEDYQLVTTFFKLNASLPPASQSRISSLYVFDAIARAAKSDLNKGIGTQVNKERGKGTQAGLLLKLEGVVDSWIEGLLDDSKGGLWIEGKEKTKKIVDIWSKAGTFPQHCLERLTKKIASAGGAQAGPSTKLKDIGRSGSSGSGPGSDGKGSTTPPYPPPAPSAVPTQPGSLPPEVAKLLGIAASPVPVLSPTGSAATLPNPTGTSTPTPAPPIIPNLDLAAILASVNKPQPSPILPGQPQPQAVASPPINIPNLANLAALLPQPQAQNAIPPSVPQPADQAGPSNMSAGPGHKPILNAAQNAALAKFAALAQAGPPPPPQMQQAGPSHPPPGGPPGGYRRSPQKGYSDLPPPPAPMRAESMRGPSSNVDNRFQNRDQGHGPGHGRRESQDYKNNGGSGNWGRRGSYENGPGPGPGSGQMGAKRNRERSRSRSPHRERRFDGRSSDSGWGNRAGRGGFHGQGNNREHDQYNNPPNGMLSNHGSGRQPSILLGNGLPPRPNTNPGQGQGQPTGNGRAPPPAWMEEPSQEGGEEDMTLDDGSDDGIQQPPIQHQNQQNYNNNNHNDNASQQPNTNTMMTLDTFPINTFNPSSPESWSNLAQAWKNSMGRDPNQLELMAFLSGGMGMGMGMGMGGGNGNGNGNM
ncbi:hypothetical protein L486_05925 [Kwoniella mangroviensis CBS 10435]|uniref:CID domain-containing protein n=1 Tax=Kwoniella mangroviensis CBS 10435 TaxID=1331196 RepID=A0A1B9IN97_9TREE|nr:hypothetical protein L486_05925 [Kwoniella mangroviensis CBS 10435]